VFARVYGLDRPPNFEGKWHLHTFVTPAELAKEAGTDAATVEAMLETARAPLLAARAKRVPPGLDDKILTSWNALMIRGLAVAARHLDRSGLGRRRAAGAGFHPCAALSRWPTAGDLQTRRGPPARLP
jgi:uncharacterized protein